MSALSDEGVWMMNWYRILMRLMTGVTVSLGLSLSMGASRLSAQLIKGSTETDQLLDFCRKHKEQEELEVSIHTCREGPSPFQGREYRHGTPFYLGIAYIQDGQTVQTLSSSKIGLPLAQTSSTQKDKAKNLYSLGHESYEKGDFEQAKNYLVSALEIYRNIDDRQGESSALKDAGFMYILLGDYSKGITFQERAIVIDREFGDELGQAHAYINLGHAYFFLGEYGKVIDSQLDAFNLFRKNSHMIGLATASGNLGNAYFNLGDHDKAFDFHKAAYQLFHSMGETYGEATALTNLGLIHHKLGNHERAIALQEQSLVIHRKIRNPYGEGAALAVIGEAHFNLGNYENSIIYFEKSLRLAQFTSSLEHEALHFGQIGVTLEKLNQPQLAISFLKNSVNITELVRGKNANLSPEQQQSYLQTIGLTYRILAKLLLQEDRTVEALQALDLLKVQELQDFFKDVDGNEQTSKGLQLFPEEKQILDSIDQVSDLHTHFQSPSLQFLSQKLQQTSSDRNLSLASYQDLNTRLQSLGQDSALLYPLVLDDRLELILFTPNKAPIHKTVSVSEVDLQASIRQYRNSLKNRNDARVLSRAKTLNDWLLKPLEKDLQEANVKTIIYAPDGALRYVPLAALYDGEQWTIEKYQINYVTAFGLTETDLPSSGTPKIMAGAYTDLGTTTVNINQTPFRFGPIPAARPEAEGVSKRFRKTKLLLDKDFNKVTLTSEQLNQHNIVHLATHGKLVSGNPSDSFILLNNGEYVTLREIKNWNLPNVDLVVLSACETALGEKLTNGIEIIGFGYQLQVAQARAAIASLWQVSDSGTNSLMNLFYEQLEKGERSPTAALGEAQRKMIQSSQRPTSLEGRGGGIRPQGLNHTPVTFSHPYFWAPFILIGNGF